MAFTTPKTWATNEVVTAANMNTHLRDNVSWLATDKFRCRATRSSVQAITTGTDTAIEFTTEEFDVGGMHDTSTNRSRITVPSGGDGLYLCGGNYLMDQNATNRRVTYLRLNGATDLVTTNAAAPNTGDYGVYVGTLVALVAGDYIELLVNQNSGGGLNVFNARFWAIWMGT